MLTLFLLFAQIDLEPIPSSSDWKPGKGSPSATANEQGFIFASPLEGSRGKVYLWDTSGRVRTVLEHDNLLYRNAFVFGEYIVASTLGPKAVTFRERYLAHIYDLDGKFVKEVKGKFFRYHNVVDGKLYLHDDLWKFSKDSHDPFPFAAQEADVGPEGITFLGFKFARMRPKAVALGYTYKGVWLADHPSLGLIGVHAPEALFINYTAEAMNHERMKVGPDSIGGIVTPAKLAGWTVNPDGAWKSDKNDSRADIQAAIRSWRNSINTVEGLAVTGDVTSVIYTVNVSAGGKHLGTDTQIQVFDEDLLPVAHNSKRLQGVSYMGDDGLHLYFFSGKSRDGMLYPIVTTVDPLDVARQ